MENQCYQEEAQPYRKTDNKPIIYIYIYTLAHTSLLITGGAIPDSKYKSSELVGFRHVVVVVCLPRPMEGMG